ncbi:hypothetical protein PS726_00931 [Pseudomonas fluorescens]|nr:hypothetical protein PS726_00931 [Pseudomonas fluorescens]
MRNRVDIPQTDHVGLGNRHLGVYLKGMCWLLGRHRRQASSHRDRGHLQNQVGWQAAIANRLTPTEKKKQSSPHHRVASHHSSGRALARLQLLILIHPPPREAERRCSSGDWRVAPFGAAELIACRSREADRRAMPPDEYRSEGTPSLGEGPDARGERFFCLLFLRRLLKK